MPDIIVSIYLYVLIFSSLLFAVLHGVAWLAQRERPRRMLVRPKLLWRNLFFIVSGLVASYLFYSRLLNNWLLMLCALLMLIASSIEAEVLGSKRITVRPKK